MFHWDPAWPCNSNEKSQFSIILMHSTYIFLPPIFFSGASKGKRLSFFSAVFTRFFCVRRSISFKMIYPKQLWTVFQGFPPTASSSLAPDVSYFSDTLFPAFTLKKSQWKWEISHTHELSPLICPSSSHSWSSFHSLHNHSAVLQGNS